ncbi:toll/interleukin-1 receptor domain-containing protein [Pseudomonas sp. 21LCFQ010]|uniref:toll/interleukin-1 receptor domain-containing protein n=1 Tax=Pseudomonas sp. 21LCFQ010 TaxID=2957506 RepID=UPI0020983B9D|nr:toll/interleukin-1 receptor domain-containing protein [Pseudomonas sp. 21LCFQ010]MCO8161089.1 toll/interleukin-1 receptor domain-containing protein [Pseudomonas sp. 21LCFQ010]
MDDHAPLYSLGLLGNIPQSLKTTLHAAITRGLEDLGLVLGRDVHLFEGSPLEFNPAIERCSAALCFDIAPDDQAAIEKLILRRVPLIPVASVKTKFSSEFPGKLGSLNGLEVSNGAVALATALLENAALVPKHRRIFLSYRRVESTELALQLFAELSARQYEVFLDTHGIKSGEHFQEVLWQRLCDSDVMIYLDTPGYFDSHWTEAEFARATIRGLSVLRVGWPDVKVRLGQIIGGEILLSDESFLPSEGRAISSSTGECQELALDRKVSDADLKGIVHKVELLRTQSVATRYAKVVNKLRNSLEEYGGEVVGHSLSRSLIVSMTGGTIAVYPELGVPTSHALYEATLNLHKPPVAVVYNAVGIKERKWRAHMDWFGSYVVDHVRLVTTDDAAWEFSMWHRPGV